MKEKFLSLINMIHLRDSTIIELIMHLVRQICKNISIDRLINILLHTINKTVTNIKKSNNIQSRYQNRLIR